jgi:hypothetical protein
MVSRGACCCVSMAAFEPAGAKSGGTSPVVSIRSGPLGNPAPGPELMGIVSVY